VPAKVNLKTSKSSFKITAMLAMALASTGLIDPAVAASNDASIQTKANTQTSTNTQTKTTTQAKTSSAAKKDSKTQLSPAAASTLKSVAAEQADTGPKFKSLSPKDDSLAEREEEKKASESKVKKARKAANEDPTPPAREGSEIFAEETSGALLLQAKQCMRQHNYNKALRLLKRAIKLNDDDMDIRVLYAEALDEKLSHQVEKDPEIFNDCIKSWLIVARQEIGDEKGMTIKGIGFMGGQYADQDWALKAKKRLRVLTGYSPKPWETNDRYLKKVLRPAETSVTGVVKTAEDEPPALSPRKKEK
jgi:hypothetical protein